MKLAESLTIPAANFVRLAVIGDYTKFSNVYTVEPGKPAKKIICKSYLTSIVHDDGDTIIPFLLNRWHHNKIPISVNKTLTNAGNVLGLILMAYAKSGIDPFSLRRRPHHQFPGLSALHIAASQMTGPQFMDFFQLCLDTHVINKINIRKVLGHSALIKNEMYQLHNIFYNKNGWDKGNHTNLGNEFYSMIHPDSNITPKVYMEGRLARASRQNTRFSNWSDMRQFLKQENNNVKGNYKHVAQNHSFGIGHHKKSQKRVRSGSSVSGPSRPGPPTPSNQSEVVQMLVNGNERSSTGIFR